MANDILYTINNKYIDLMLASFLSLYQKSSFSNIRLHLITSEFTKEDYAKVSNFLKGLNVAVYFYPLEEFAIEKYHLPNWRNTQISNARLFFQEIMAKNLTNIANLLYLDADTIITSPLTELKNLTTTSLGAVVDYGTNKNAARLHLNKYFNSGVLNIDINKWLQNANQDRIIHTIENTSRSLLFPDQDILNIALADEISSLPLSYNINNYAYFYDTFLAKLYFNGKHRQVSYSDVVNAKKNPNILHAYGFSSLKPWSNNKSNPFNSIFMNYLLQVNKEFQKEELNSFQKILDQNPELLKILILIKSYTPQVINDKLSDILKAVNDKPKIKQK